MPEDKRPRGAGAPPGSPEPLRPTVVQPPARSARGLKPLAAPAVAKPTVITGVRRAPIVVSADEVQAMSPGASAAACEEAARLLATVTETSLDERKATRWGQVLLQSDPGRANLVFLPGEDSVAEQASAQLARMVERLAAIDLVAVCGHRKEGVLGGLARPINRKVDTPAELARALDELRFLLEQLRTGADRLLVLRQTLQERADAVARWNLELEAASLAALLLSRRLTDRPSVAQRFEERSLVLAAQRAQGPQGGGRRQALTEHPWRFIDVLEEVVLARMPSFIAEMGALLALAKTGKALPIEAMNMDFRRQDILHQLRTQETTCRNPSSST